MLGGAGASKTLRGQTGFGVAWWMPPLLSMMLAWVLWKLHVRSVMERRAIMQSCPPGPPGARPSRMLYFGGCRAQVGAGLIRRSRAGQKLRREWLFMAGRKSSLADRGWC